VPSRTSQGQAAADFEVRTGDVHRADIEYLDAVNGVVSAP
jgi:hypothetical protein